MDSDVLLCGGAGQMQGDARRYQLSIEKDPETRSRLQAEALAAYQAATEGVEAAELAPTNPVRLNLALNMAVFHHSALGKPEEAVRIAQTARDAAVDALDAMDEVRPDRSHASFLGRVKVFSRQADFEATTRSLTQIQQALSAWNAAPKESALRETPLGRRRAGTMESVGSEMTESSMGAEDYEEGESSGSDR